MRLLCYLVYLSSHIFRSLEVASSSNFSEEGVLVVRVFALTKDVSNGMAVNKFLGRKDMNLNP